VTLSTVDGNRLTYRKEMSAMQTKYSGWHILPHEGSRVWVAGDLITFKVLADDTSGDFVVAEDVTPPGGGPPPHIHQNEDEIFFILSGEYEFLLGDRTVRAGAGSVLYGPRGVPHTFKNVGQEPAKMLAIVTPACFEQFLFEAGDDPTDGSKAPDFGAEQIERMLAVAPKYGIQILSPESE
jgi:mannose-6-phosphate isomerase-like protein (cupin superfamily)